MKANDSVTKFNNNAIPDQIMGNFLIKDSWQEVDLKGNPINTGESIPFSSIVPPQNLPTAP